MRFLNFIGSLGWTYWGYRAVVLLGPLDGFAALMAAIACGLLAARAMAEALES